MYPYRTDAEQATLEQLPHGPYAYNDTPHLSVNRYSMIGFEEREVDAKRAVDMQGAQDMLWWYNFTKEENRVNRRDYV